MILISFLHSFFYEINFHKDTSSHPPLPLIEILPFSPYHKNMVLDFYF